MAWTTVYPTATMMGEVTFSTQRIMLGLVRMRLLDVSLTNGVRFHDGGQMDVWLVSSGGATLAGPTMLYKSWGVTGPWATVGYFSAPTAVQLRIRAYVQEQAGSGPRQFSFRAELAWDNGTGAS